MRFGAAWLSALWSAPLFAQTVLGPLPVPAPLPASVRLPLFWAEPLSPGLPPVAVQAQAPGEGLASSAVEPVAPASGVRWTVVPALHAAAAPDGGRFQPPASAAPAMGAVHDAARLSDKGEAGSSVWRLLFDGLADRGGGSVEIPGAAARGREIPFNGTSLPPRAFSDKTRIREHLIRAIDSSRESIDLAIHGLSVNALAGALLRAKKRGVRVRIIMNETHVYPEKSHHGRSPEVQSLIDNGFDMKTLRGSGPFGVMHNKFAVFDGKLLEGGSFNWSAAADDKNFENAVFLDEGHRVAGFQGYWDWMWAQAKPLQEGPGAAGVAVQGSPPCDPARPARLYGEAFPAYSFSPDGGTTGWLVKAVRQAKISIDLAMFSFTALELQQALLDARGRGVKIRIVFDLSQSRHLSDMKWFIDQSFDVRLSGGKNRGDSRGVMHNKFAVFDGALLETGSFNWTANAQGHNFENAQFFDSKDDVADYSAYFERLWAQAQDPAGAELSRTESLPEGFEIH